MNFDGLPSLGDTVVGKYRLTRELGRGGMGAVYEALHLRLDQKVAIKVVLPGVAQRPELAYRFEHEARAAARLRGRHTARVFDVDTSPEGLRYLVMELLEGHSLRDELDRRGPLSVGMAVHYAREACEGVDEAHRAGIIHRDIKPANLFLSAEGGGHVVKVVDFGIAKASGPADDHYQTATNAPLGTYKYMSPEQAHSARSVDARTDIWSLGVVLYQLLAGKTPFTGEGVPGVIYAIATQAPPPLRAVRPDVPEGLVTVIERALCKDAAGRYQTVRELSDGLAPFDATSASLPPRLPSRPALTPVAGLPRHAPSSRPPLTPAQGLTPEAPVLRIEHAPTEPQQAPPYVATTPLPILGGGVSNESVTSGTKSHVVPIRPSITEVGPLSRSRWIVGALTLVVGGGVAIGVKVARVRSDVAASMSAASSEKAPPVEATPAKATGSQPSPGRETPSPSVKPVEDVATDPTPVPSAKGPAARPRPQTEASNATTGRSAGKARQGKPPPGKPAAEPPPQATSSAAHPRPAPPPDPPPEVL